MKINSIRFKLLVFFIIIILVIATSISIIGIVQFKNFATENARVDVKTDLDGFELELEKLNKSALSYSAIFSMNQNVVKAVTTKDTDVIIAALKPLIEHTNLDFVTVCDAQGVVLARTHEPEKKGDSVLNQANVKAALSGKAKPYVEKGTQIKLSARAASPLYAQNGELMGAVSLGYSLDTDALIDRMKSQYLSDFTIFLGDERISTTIIKDGKRVVGTKLDPKIAQIVLANGQEYNGSAKIVGLNYITAYKPIIGPDGQAMGVLFAGMDQTKVDKFVTNFMLIIIIVALAALVITLLISYFYLGSSINKPIQEIVTATDKMAKGNLNVHVNYRSKNEFGQLADGMMMTVRAMQTYIGNIAQTLGKMAKGDISVTVDMDYIGDFAQIKDSMVEITDSLNEILTQINQSSNQVLSGAAQVSSAAQSLSQGTTEQASSIEELSATIQHISSQISKNAENAQNAKIIAVDSSRITENANVQMTSMITAMEHINETSRKISKIIKTIDDIAFQTNILALNAAVEAARAGEAGKGFAVVADEVRNLASKSAEAAKDTTALIENSIEAVDKGTKIANETAKSLVSIVESAKRSADLIAKISDASALQANAIRQSTQGVEQISSVVQMNSATAEESAAASEELSGQADMLNQLVGKFKLRSAHLGFETELKIERPKNMNVEIKPIKGIGKY